MIQIEHIDGYARYFLKNEIEEKHADILNILRKKTSRRILILIFVLGVCSKKQLSICLNKNPSTIHHYLKKLEKLDVIESVNSKNNLVKINYSQNVFYKIKKNKREIFIKLKNPYLLYDVFVIYKNKLFDDKIINDSLVFFNFFVKEEYYPADKEKIVLGQIDTTIENLEDILFNELFPIPFIA